MVPQQDPDELARNVGRRIAEIGADAALTQQELATMVQASVQWISRVETGRENLTLATMTTLANGLAVTVVDFLSTPIAGGRRTGPRATRKS